MSEYDNIRISINSTDIPNSLIAKGTYSFIKDKRVAGEWTDGNGITHQDIFTDRKVTITFSIRERSLTEQESIVGIFAAQEDVPVEYWDDYDCTYKTGMFRMNAPTIQHLTVANNDIEYATTQIVLEEY